MPTDAALPDRLARPRMVSPQRGGHMVQAMVVPHNQALFWNLSSNVGPGQPNKADDVEFVRFAYFLMKDNPKAMTGDFVTLKPILQKVTTTGAFDNNLAD